ncbi:MAG: hypothetical protein AAFP02_11165, partial [Bacteroidota bacterium]
MNQPPRPYRTRPFWVLWGLVFALSGNAYLHAQEALFQERSLPEDFVPQLICQDQEGFLWLGGEGLFRYDGLEYEAIPLPDSLSQITISALLDDGRGTLWVGFSNGNVLSLSLEQQAQISNRFQIGTKAIRDIQICGGKQIWFATAGDGLWYQTNNELNWQKQEGMPDEYLYSLINGPNQQLWAGTDRGIVVINPQTHQIEDIPLIAERFANEIVQVLLPDGPEAVWIGTYDGGLFRYDQAFHEVVKIPLNNLGSIQSLAGGSQGIWIGTQRQGLHWWGKDQQTHLLSEDKRLRIKDILYDRDGNLWTIDQTNGLRVAMAAFSQYRQEGSVQALHATDKYVWFADRTGVFRFEEKSGRSQRLPIDLKGRVLSLYEDSKAYLWIGTQGDGLWRYHPDGVQYDHITEADGLISNHILSISEGVDSIWLATFGG